MVAEGYPMRPIIVLSLLLACAVASAAEVYKWKDKDGRVHYGDKPKSGQAEALDIEPSSGTGQPSTSLAEQQARAAECKQKKEQLAAWRRGPTMSETDNLGRTREYTPAEREQFLNMTQKKVDELCAPREPSPEAAGTFPPPEGTYTPIEPPPAEPAPESR
jgi:hypothetical protein